MTFISPAPGHDRPLASGLAVVIRVFVMGLILAGHPGRAQELAELIVPGGAGVTQEELRGWVSWLQARGFDPDRCGLDPVAGSLFLDIEAGAPLGELEAAGFVVVSRQSGTPLEGSRRTQSEYYDPAEIEALLQQVHADHPAITRLITVGTTFEGRTILGIEISDAPGIDEDEPAVLLNGQHHSREVVTSHIVVDAIDTLTDGYGIDTTLTSWVDGVKTICVPMVNPDGVQHVFDVSSFWRKNRQTYPGGCTGVDLNRNYPYRWGPDRCGSTSSCASPTQTYEGPSSASEIETQAMMALAAAHPLVIAVSYHSAGRFIDYPYACSSGLPSEIMPEHDVIHEMMNSMADAIDAVDAVPRYSVFSPASAGALSGDDTSWYYAEKGVYSFIVEVGTSFEPPFSEVAGIVDRNRAGWQELYQRLEGARIDVHVADAGTGQPLEAEVALLDYVYDTGEAPRWTHMPFGRFTYLVPGSDTYTVRASRPGYVTRDVAVAVGMAPEELTIALELVGGPSQVPALSTLALGLLGLLFLAGGAVAVRRQTA